LEHAQQLARKKHAKKKKNNMQEEKPHGEEVGKPNHDRVGVFDKDCNGYKPVIV
jgi:hypothetical protein